MIDLEPLESFLLATGLSVVRILAVFLVVPLFGQETLPGTVRTGVVLSIAFVIYPAVAPLIPPDGIPLVELTALLFKEIVIGILFGFVFSLPFRVAEGAGFLIDNQRGTGMAAVFDPMAGGEVTPLAVLLLRMVITLFLAFGGFIVFFKALFLSYEVYPVVSAFPVFSPAAPAAFLGLADKTMFLILVLTAPIMIALFASEFGLGLVNRFAPALNVFFLAMPIKSAIAVLMLALMLPTLFDSFISQFREEEGVVDFLRNVFAVPQP